MNGWIESGRDFCALPGKFGKVIDTDLVLRTEDVSDAVVFCNGNNAPLAGMYVSDNRVGVGMRPRPFTALDVHGTIFGDSKLELCAGGHPVSYPRFVAEPHRLYFANSATHAPVVIDAIRGCVVSDSVLVRNTMGVVANSLAVPVRRVVTSDVATDIDVDKVVMQAIFPLGAKLCIERAVTQVVQLTDLGLVPAMYRLTLVPPLPPHIVSDSILRVAPITEPVMLSARQEDTMAYTRVRLLSPPVKVNDYNWDVECEGVWADMSSLQDLFVAVSTSVLHNYQKVVLVKTVTRDAMSNKTTIRLSAPCLKNPLDLSEFTEFIYMYHLSYPTTALWQHEYDVTLAFFVDSSRQGYYLAVEQSNLITMLNSVNGMEHLNAIDQVVMGDPAMYNFTVTKTYVRDGRAMLYIDTQTRDHDMPLMFSGVFPLKYKLTGVPLLFKTITRLDDCTVRIECEGVQGFSFGDGMTMITSDEQGYEYILLNDTLCVSWRLLSAELGKGITVRCSDAAVVDAMVSNQASALPRVVYALPLRGKAKPAEWHNAVVLGKGELVFKDPGMRGPDVRVTYDGQKLDVGDVCSLSKTECHFDTEQMTVEGGVYAHEFTQLSDARFKTNVVPVDTAADLEFIKGLQLKEYDLAGSRMGQKKRGVIAQEVEGKMPVGRRSGVLPDGTLVDDLRVLDTNEILMRCVGAVQELVSRGVAPLG